MAGPRARIDFETHILKHVEQFQLERLEAIKVVGDEDVDLHVGDRVVEAIG